MIWSVLALPIGFMLDLILGDPKGWPHPIVGIGKLISIMEKVFRRIFPKTPIGENVAGLALWIVVVGISTAIPMLILMFSYELNLYLGIAIESIMCWQILAAKSLKSESMKVHYALENSTIEDARYQVSMIVGRDTQSLDDAGVTRAAVETVAENTSDGIIAPMFYMAFGGAAAGFAYKAVNTMDSMLGYIEEPYKNIGFFPANMDDVVNYLPARISAIFMLLAGRILGLDVENGKRIFIRDRYNHASPNSAQTESVCAGLLNVRLAGDAWYHGVLHKKKYIGDAFREIQHEDIPRTCRLMYVTAVISLIVCVAIHWCLLFSTYELFR